VDQKIQNLSAEIDHMAPNMKATERLGDVADKLRDAETEAEVAKKASKAARDRFNEVRRERLAIFAFALRSGLC
jgi:structural maintenance of chromosome 1